MWLLAGVGLFYATMILVLSQNLFSWSPNVNIVSISALLSLLLLLITTFLLARFTKGEIEKWVALLVCLSLIGFGAVVLYDFYTEHLSGDLFGRSVLSPQWFRLGVFSIFSLPLLFLMIYPFRKVRILYLMKYLVIYEFGKSKRTVATIAGRVKKYI